MKDWTPEKQAAYVGAKRVVPAMMAARWRCSADDAMALLADFFVETEATGLATCEVWAVLFSASMSWYANSVRALGLATEEDPTQILQDMSMAAAAWEASGGN